METAEAMRSVRSQMNLSLAAEKGCKKATLVIIFISLCFQGKLENLKFQKNNGLTNIENSWFYFPDVAAIAWLFFWPLGKIGYTTSRE